MIFESVVISSHSGCFPFTFSFANYFNSTYNVGTTISSDTFITKLSSDLQTSISYHEGSDISGDMVSYLQFDSITGSDTTTLTGIPLSIFDETHILGQINTQTSQATLTATQNKLYFKYLTLPNAMTIVKDSNETTTFSSGSTFMHKFIHQMEYDLSMNISFNANNNPDSLVVYDFNPNSSIKTTRLRRATDNVEDDFYHDGFSFVNSSNVVVSTWAGASDVYITILYNQSTLSDTTNLIQTDTAKQPKLDLSTFDIDFGTSSDDWYLYAEDATKLKIAEGVDNYSYTGTMTP